MAHALHADSTWIVIAAYNEVTAIGSTIDGVRALYPNVVVIDDGSADGTLGVAAAHGAHTVRHPVNLGQGAALQTGIEYALRRGAARIVTFDADGQHLPEDVPRLLAALEETGADIACGSRFLGRTVDLPASRMRPDCSRWSRRPTSGTRTGPSSARCSPSRCCGPDAPARAQRSPRAEAGSSPRSRNAVSSSAISRASTVIASFWRFSLKCTFSSSVKLMVTQQ